MSSPIQMPPGPPARKAYLTAMEAVAGWERGETIEVPVLGDPMLADQRAAYALVFEIVKKAQPFSASWSYLQFESLCFKNKVGVPRVAQVAQPACETHGYIPEKYDPEDERKCAVAKGFAFDILRQGFEVVLQQKFGRGVQRIPVKK